MMLRRWNFRYIMYFHRILLYNHWRTTYMYLEVHMIRHYTCLCWRFLG